ncbi:hypothetical protein H4R99_007430 [Coemansia sp. RSA 1722]|nr:hypothetical protein H4R99_007430 [Coemansia sp. RSA 1722]
MTLRTAANDRSNSSRVVNIDGEAYVRRGHGNKLVRASAVPATKPKAGAGSAGNKRIVSIDGDDFVRSKKGSLIRVSALRLYNSHMRGSSKSYQSSAFRAPKRRSKRLCTRFLYDKCEKTAEECGFSHELSPETVPLCLHYQRDMCTKPGCRFVHRKINPEAPICREFVYKGFCPKGNSCKHRHIWQCPDWVEKGKCLRKKCKLPHPDPSKNTAASIQSSAEAIGQRQMSKEDEQNFVKNFIQRPRFDKNSGSDEIDDLLAFENESYQSEKEGDDDDDDDDEEEGGGDLEDDLSGDEAEELLKWYDDNHSTDQDSKQVAA